MHPDLCLDLILSLRMDGINCKILSSNRAVGFKIRAYSLGLMQFSVLSMYLHLWPLCCMPLAVLGLLASSSFNWKGATWVVTRICIQLFQFEFWWGLVGPNSGLSFTLCTSFYTIHILYSLYYCTLLACLCHAIDFLEIFSFDGKQIKWRWKMNT